MNTTTVSRSGRPPDVLDSHVRLGDVCFVEEKMPPVDICSHVERSDWSVDV